jgi:hypothetical protein
LEAYYKEIGIRIYLGDVLKVLGKLPKESVDLIFLVMREKELA